MIVSYFKLCLTVLSYEHTLKDYVTFSDKKKRKEDSKVPVRNVKERSGDEEKKKEKPKAHAPSHTKIRSIGNSTQTCSGIVFFHFNYKILK